MTDTVRVHVYRRWRWNPDRAVLDDEVIIRRDHTAADPPPDIVPVWTYRMSPADYHLLDWHRAGYCNGRHRPYYRWSEVKHLFEGGGSDG